MPDVFKDTKSPSTPLAPQPQSITILNEKARKPGLFTAFCPKPIGLSFETQEPDEAVLLLIRRHFITNLSWILTALFFFFFSFFLIPFLRSDIFTSLFIIPDRYILVFFLLYYLILIGFVLQQFATWYYQVGIITNFRVIDIDFNSLLSRNVAYTDIMDIVDIEIMQGGFLHNTFDYGTVQMQTEGLKANFEFVNIPRPHVVADTISDIMRKEKGGKK